MAPINRHMWVFAHWNSRQHSILLHSPIWTIAHELGRLDFQRVAKVTGARFAVYRGALAWLERALISFMLDIHTEQHSYTEVLTPFLVNPDSMRGIGQFPKFKDDAFVIERDNLGFIPIAEVPLTNLHRDEIFDEGDSPRRYTACTPCFEGRLAHMVEMRGG